MSLEALPKEILDDIELAKSIILEAGAKEIYIFGSIANGQFSDESDLDIGIIGLEKKRFFQVYGELISRLKRPVDIIGLDYNTEFSHQVKNEGIFIRVA
ncbi:nucleotidyltransferase domain-containing protein [Marispirochaeta sp.]|uniref:nucleotidyltransferase family protein n=1 Tax=Marispirochaeta sp. TaxID=2038653 RepID=UPI0029C84817|nr:nucleotidyltransferase domain-containing protein [Marispirochaeta sp.]